MMSRWRLLTLFALVLSVGFQIWLERTNRADSLGLWYTLFSATIYTVLLLLVAKVVVVVRRRLFH